MHALLLLLALLAGGGCVSETGDMREAGRSRMSQDIPRGVTGLRTRADLERERRIAMVIVLSALVARAN